MTSDAKYTGTGWAFPPDFLNQGAGVAMVSGDDDVLQSLHILLSTALGERVMRPDFGCDLRAYAFEEMNGFVLSEIQRSLADAIKIYEARVQLESLDIDDSDSAEGRLTIAITFRSRATNARFNMVYPFYLDEAVIGPTDRVG